MTKVVLLGDSIRQIGYGKVVPQTLGEDFDVWQPDDNCRYSKYTFRWIHDNRACFEDVDIVHWNNGLWDTCDLIDGKPFTPIEEYIDNMTRIARYLKARSKVVIFATTTAVNEKLFDQTNARIIKYNNAVVPKLEELGVLINDLHSLVYPNIDKYIADDLIHLSDAGIEACGRKVADAIKQAAKLL